MITKCGVLFGQAVLPRPLIISLYTHASRALVLTPERSKVNV